MNILLVQTSFLGDVVLSTPLIANLKSIYPDAKLSVLTTPAAKDLIEHHPQVDETLVFDKRGKQSGLGGLLNMASRLREKNFEVVFSLHKSWRTAALLFLAGIPERYGFKKAAAAWSYGKTAEREDCEHEVLRNLALLRTIGREPTELETRLQVVLPDFALDEADALLENAKPKTIIGIAPGSVWATKRWTVEGFASLADTLGQSGYYVVLIGGPDDADVAAQIISHAKEPVLNLVGRCSLIVSAALIAKSALLVSNDSAPLHLASASGTPAVGIFCATIPGFGYGPWQNPSETVGVDGLSCRPCGRHGGQSCPTGTHACQRELHTDVVVAAVERVLKNAAQQKGHG